VVHIVWLGGSNDRRRLVQNQVTICGPVKDRMGTGYIVLFDSANRRKIGSSRHRLYLEIGNDNCSEFVTVESCDGQWDRGRGSVIAGILAYKPNRRTIAGGR